MNTYNDDDQVELLKNWWSNNGTSTVVSIFVAISIIFGWQYYQDANLNKKENASLAYQELIEAVFDIEQNADDIKIARAIFMADKIKSDFGKSAYGHFSALLKARQAVQDGDLELAKEELNWVLSKDPVDEIRYITTLRLAKVLFEQDRNDEALALLDSEPKHSFSHAFLELKGDIFFSVENYSEAVDAYEKSIDISKELGLSLSQLLDIKLNHARTFL